MRFFVLPPSPTATSSSSSSTPFSPFPLLATSTPPRFPPLPFSFSFYPPPLSLSLSLSLLYTLSLSLRRPAPGFPTTLSTIRKRRLRRGRAFSHRVACEVSRQVCATSNAASENFSRGWRLQVGARSVAVRANVFQRYFEYREMSAERKMHF